MLPLLSAVRLVEDPVVATLVIAAAWAVAITAIGVMDHQSRRRGDTLANCHPGFDSRIDSQSSRRRGWW